MKNIGLFGLGNVGQGLLDFAQHTPDFPFTIAAIVVKTRGKKRDTYAIPVSTDPQLIWGNSDIDIIIEAIDDSEAALAIAEQAAAAGKHYITANKKMVATTLEQILALRRKHHHPIGIEACVGGAIPVIGALLHNYTYDPILGLRGILNGTTNYILTQIFALGKSLDQALHQAQELGFAESDPSNDMSGRDAWYKTKLLLFQTFGIDLPLQEIPYFGIQTLTPNEVAWAKAKRQKIKLVAEIQWRNDQCYAWVLPTFVSEGDALHAIEHEQNAIEIRSQFAGQQLLVGPGAGAHPTASALVQDLLAPSLRHPQVPPTTRQSLAKAALELELYVSYKGVVSCTLAMPAQILEGYLRDDHEYIRLWIAHSELPSLIAFVDGQGGVVVATGRQRQSEVHQSKETTPHKRASAESVAKTKGPEQPRWPTSQFKHKAQRPTSV